MTVKNSVRNDGPEGVVTRREFVDALDKIAIQVDQRFRESASKIDELVRAKQISWPLIIAILTLATTVLGFGIKNWGDVAAMKADVANTEIIANELRERTRALESNTHAVVVENETQNRWMADVINLQHQHLEAFIRSKNPEFPTSTYWPLSKVGGASVINGGGK